MCALRTDSRPGRRSLSPTKSAEPSRVRRTKTVGLAWWRRSDSRPFAPTCRTWNRRDTARRDPHGERPLWLVPELIRRPQRARLRVSPPRHGACRGDHGAGIRRTVSGSPSVCVNNLNPQTEENDTANVGRSSSGAALSGTAPGILFKGLPAVPERRLIDTGVVGSSAVGAASAGIDRIERLRLLASRLPILMRKKKTHERTS